MRGENNQSLIIVDADAIIALSNTSDAKYQKATHVLQFLSASQAATLFPTTAICEAVTVLRGRLNQPDDAARIMQKFLSGDFPVQAVDQEILRDAAALYSPQASKKNTLFDAVIAAIAKKLHAEAIFSFDGWYKKVGLTLVNDFIEQEKAA